MRVGFGRPFPLVRYSEVLIAIRTDTDLHELEPGWYLKTDAD